MICYRVKSEKPIKGYAVSYCKKFENAVREQNKMEAQTKKRWYIDRVEL